MAQRGSISSKTGQKPSVPTKASNTPVANTNANKSATVAKPATNPQSAAPAKPAASTASSAPAPALASASAAAASSPAQPKTPAKHASPPKPQDPLQRILMSAAAKALSAPEYTGIPAPVPPKPQRRPPPMITSSAPADESSAQDLASSLGRDNARGPGQGSGPSSRRSSVLLGTASGPSLRPASAAQPLPPFSPGGSKTPAAGSSTARQSAASPLQARTQRGSVMHTPLRPDAHDGAAPDTEGGVEASSEADPSDDASQAPQQSLAQTLANARAMLAGLGVSPPSTPHSSKTLPAVRGQEAAAAGTAPGGDAVSPVIMRLSTDDTAAASASDHVSDLDEADGEDDGEDEDEGHEDEEDDIGEDDDPAESTLQRGSRETDDDLGRLPNNDDLWEGFEPQAGSFELPSRMPTNAASLVMLPPPPSAQLLASAAKVASQTPSPERSRRPSYSEATDVMAEQQQSHPESPDSPYPLEAASNPEHDDIEHDDLELDNLEQDDFDQENLEPDNLEEDLVEEIAEEELASSEQQPELHRHGQPADVAEQQAVTTQPQQQASVMPPVPLRAPPPQPSIMQLQNYSAPKPASRAIPNAYADLAGSLSMDEDALEGLEGSPRGDADGESASAGVVSSSSMHPGQLLADSSQPTPPQGPPMLHHLAPAEPSEGEAWFAGQELNELSEGQDLAGENAELLSGPTSDAPEPRSDEPLPGGTAAAGRRKVYFSDATAATASEAASSDGGASSLSGLAKGPATAAAAIKAAVKRLSGDSAPDVPVGSSLKVHAVTFNMNTRLPTLMQTAALLGLEARPGHSHFHPSCDVYAVGSQESGGLKPWRKLISRCLGGHFVRLASESLMAISLMVYVRRSLANECLDISTTNIATGIGNVLGNKGAVAAALTVRSTRLLFICAHFAAHEKQIQQRNAEAARIRASLFLRSGGGLGKLLGPQGSGQLLGGDENLPASSPKKSLSLEAPPNKLTAVQALQLRADSSAPASSMASETDRQALVQPLLRASSLTGQPGRDVTDLFDLTFWMGDLNYRLVGTRANVDFALGQHMYELLKPLDQLLLERAKGVVFQDFQEGDIQFPPTFKYDLGSDRYDTSSKKRIPSWTDRILWRLRCEPGVPGPVSIEQLRYNHVPEVDCSDHKPVFAAFKLNMRHPPQPRAAIPFWLKLHNMLLCYDD